MKTFAWATLLVAASFASTSWAAADGAAVTANPPTAATVKAPTAQQKKMSSCNADAGTRQLKGAERKAFMKNCLSASGASSAVAAKPATPQARMKDCNKQAGDQKLTGDSRKTFMSSCLKAS
jgi:hypothetical protein